MKEWLSKLIEKISSGWERRSRAEKTFILLLSGETVLLTISLLVLVIRGTQDTSNTPKLPMKLGGVSGIEDSSPVVVSVLDGARGVPLASLQVKVLREMGNGILTDLAMKLTGLDGATSHLLSEDLFPAGRYRIEILVRDHFRLRKQPCWISAVEIPLEVEKGDSPFTILVSLTPYSYSVHRIPR